MPESFVEIISNPYVLIVLLTFAPALELRASIPYGILIARMPWFIVAPMAVGANILLGPIVYFGLAKFLHLLLRVRGVNRLWDRFVVRTQKKVHPLVEKYGVIGLSLFIGVPLPGSGVYSGAVGGYLLGFRRREFYLSTVIGVLIAAAAVSAVVVVVDLTGTQALDFFIKRIQR